MAVTLPSGVKTISALAVTQTCGCASAGLARLSAAKAKIRRKGVLRGMLANPRRCCRDSVDPARNKGQVRRPGSSASAAKARRGERSRETRVRVGSWNGHPSPPLVLVLLESRSARRQPESVGLVRRADEEARHV